MRRLVFVRHGSTEANTTGVLRGWSGDPLSSEGYRQAEMTAVALRTMLPIDAIYTSTLTRAVQTGEVLAKALTLPAIARDDLRELNLGSMEGHSERELWDYFAERAGLATGEMRDVEFPGGESARSFVGRVMASMSELHERHREGTVVVVSHGVFTMVALGLWLEPDPTQWPKYRVENCSITEVTFEPDARLMRLNDRGHLKHE